jgi:sortase (surface protein transpeptidase)
MDVTVMERIIRLRSARRLYIRLVTSTFLGMAVGALLMHQYIETQFSSDPVLTGEINSAPDAASLPSSEPAYISIPTIGLSASFEEPLGLNPDRTIEVPDTYEKVGWYQFGPTPGEIGPAVVLGHVDSFRGPAVFYRLKELKEGDPIMVTRKDGSVAIFRVTAQRNYAQSDFPSELVYGDINHAGLRLITCTGVYDKGVQRYSHNLIVYAALEKE